MLHIIDNLLNKITMYRLVLYILFLLLSTAVLFSLFGWLPYNPLLLLFSTFFLLAACWIFNIISAKIFHAPVNVESVYITALILALIIKPPTVFLDINYLVLAFWACVWAMVSKFIFAIGNKHIFNPAAFAVALTALTLNQSASWWIGTAVMLPFVAVSGLLMVKKMRRFDLVLSFFFVALVTIVAPKIMQNVNLATFIGKTFTNTPMLFFAFIMLTEPLTTPPTKKLRMLYGAIVGFLFAPWVHIGSVYSTPELALLVGNIFSYLVSPKQKLLLLLQEKKTIAENTMDFIFKPDRPLVYAPGQYMEWTFAHSPSDSRGNRRYFTLASSPTEKNIRLGIKFYPEGSSFKNALLSAESTDLFVGSQLAGDFTLPKNKNEKLVFIAGGIGVTPFRSMITYLIDRNEQRSIVLFYSNNIAADIAYADVFDVAEKQLGIKTVYTLTDAQAAPAHWKGKIGYVDEKMIVEEVPDYKERTFYVSGPHGMVTAFDRTLKKMGVPRARIKKDFFPGFA